MEDEEFLKFQLEIANLAVELEKLQQKYIKQTGRLFVLGQSIQVERSQPNAKSSTECQ